MHGMGFSPAGGADSAIGWIDDGTESGALRAAIVRGDLVPVPIRTGQYTTTQNGTSTINEVAIGVESNEDGSSAALMFSAVAGTNQGCGIQLIAYGRVVGIRWRRDTAAANPATFTVTIDGVAYGVPTAPLFLGQSINLTDGHCYYVVADNLSDGPHSVGVFVNADPAGGTNRTLIVYGLLLERRAGYGPPLHIQTTTTPVVLTTSATSINRLGGTARALRGVRKILYTNTSGSPATVTFQINGTTVWQKSIAAGDSADLDFGALTAMDTTYKHLASATSAITAMLIGGY